jgi:hypothetical protein
MFGSILFMKAGVKGSESCSEVMVTPLMPGICNDNVMVSIEIMETSSA